MFHVTAASKGMVEENVDSFGDSYARDVTTLELKKASALRVSRASAEVLVDIRRHDLGTRSFLQCFLLQNGTRSARP